MEQLYTTYFGAGVVSRERFEFLWNAVAATLKLDPNRLRPSDRFDTELSPVEGHLVEDELIDLTEFYVNECNRMGIAADSKPQTLDEFIRLLGNPTL